MYKYVHICPEGTLPGGPEGIKKACVVARSLEINWAVIYILVDDELAIDQKDGNLIETPVISRKLIFYNVTALRKVSLYQMSFRASRLMLGRLLSVLF